jgi:hypothetical protein
MNRHRTTIKEKPMIARCVIVTGLFLALQISSVWAGETLLQQNWGNSFENQKQLQTANPEGVATSASPAGLDGEAAKVTMDAYRASFKGSKSGQQSAGTSSSSSEIMELTPVTSVAGGF